MFLIQQSIEHTLALLAEADAPLSRPQWMDNDSIRRVDKASSKRNRAHQTITRDCLSSITFQQREVNVTVLPPRACEAFIKATNPGKTGAAIKAVGGYKGGCCKPSGIQFVIGGNALQRYNEPSRYAHNVICKSRQACSQPPRRWDTVIICEGYDLAASNTPTGIACGSRAVITRYSYIAHRGTRALFAGKGTRNPTLAATKGIHHPPGLIASRIISNNHLVVRGIKILRHKSG